MPLDPLPLDRVRVVEAGRYAAGPSCATVLAGWGATVIKIEPTSGDPSRGPGSSRDGGRNPRFELHNRSRRSIALDLSRKRGRQLAHQLIATADVFVTNMRPSVLRRLELDEPTLRQVHPSLIYAQITGFGLDSSAADTASFDHGAFWSHSGMAAMFADKDGIPPQPAGGMGDRAAGAMLAGAIGTALFARCTTGRGAHVTASLAGTGAWLLGSDMSDALRGGELVRKADRRHMSFPTMNCYRTGDDRWLWLQLMHPQDGWTELLAAIDAAWIDDDERFRGGHNAAEYAPVLIELLDTIFAERTAEEWTLRLSSHNVRHAVVQSIGEAARDDVMRDSGAFVATMRPDGQPNLDVAAPCAFRSSVAREETAAPAIGEHTCAILEELELSDDEIEALRADGVVR